MKTKKELMDEMLQQAVEANNLKRAEELIKIGAEYEDLEHCIQSNMREMAGILLLQQKCLRISDISKCLEWAVNSKYTELIETILKKDIRPAYVRAWYSGYETPLDLAIKNNDMDMVKFLVELGVDVNDNNHNFGMRHQIMNSNITWVKFFIDLGVKLDNLLPTAVSSNNKDVVELLLENGAIMEKNLILRHAESKEMAEFLISLGADVNGEDGSGQTPLHWNIITNKPLDLIRFLIDSGADVNTKDNDGKTPLHMAVGGHNIDCVKLLIEMGADVGAKNSYGQTPIMQLNPELTNAKKILKLLIAHGADVNAKDNADDTLLHRFAKISSAVSFIELLIKHGADVNAKNHRGDTPLHISAYNDLFSTSRVFIDSGADVFALNNSKYTPEDGTSSWRESSKKIKKHIQNTVANLSPEEVQRRKEKAMEEYDKMMGNAEEKEKEKEKSEKELIEEIEQMISALYEEEA